MSEKLFEGNLPKPLSNEEITELFIKYQNGSKQARETLITHNMRLVIYEVCTKFKNVKYNKKDLISIGSIGLIKAIDTFDMSKNTKFATYASKCINNEILMFLDKIKRDKDVESLNKKKPDEKYSKLEKIIDSNIDLEQNYEQKEQAKSLLLLIDLLPDRERTIIEMYFGLHQNRVFTQEEIANTINVSQPEIYKIITKITNTLKELLQELSNGKAIIVKDEIELPSLYDLLESFTVKEIDELLSLPMEERSLVLLKGGLIDAKMPSINPFKLQKHITKEVCLNLLDYLLESPPIMDNLTLKEAMIFSFRLGFIGKHHYNTTSIANFLELDEEEVIEMLRKAIIKISQNKKQKHSLKK